VPVLLLATLLWKYFSALAWDAMQSLLRVSLHGGQVGKGEPVSLRRWAVGVLVYEMVAGYPPFYDEDRVAMFRNICQVKYSVPSHFSKVCNQPPADTCPAAISRVYAASCHE
jgi:serine/threonine protein kinase